MDAGDHRTEERSKGMKTPPRWLAPRRLGVASRLWHPRPVAAAAVASVV